MDVSWRKMSPEEIGISRDLSGDLYSISESLVTDVKYSAELAASVSHAMDDEEWSRALSLIRKNASAIPSDVAAFLRGMCWSGLGIEDAAAEFFAHAVRLCPKNSEFLAVLLASLLKSGRQREALPIAIETISEFADIPLQLVASEVIALCAESSVEPEAFQLHSKFIEATDSLLSRLPTEAFDENGKLKHQVVAIHLHRALSYDYLGLGSKASEECRLALLKEPASLDTYMVMGLLEDQAPVKPSSTKNRVSASWRIVADSSFKDVKSPTYQIAELP